MPRRPILVATDLSPAADEAIRRGHARATATRAPMVVVHVSPQLLRSFPMFPQQHAEAAVEAALAPARAAEAVAMRVVELTGAEPADVEVVVADGAPHQAILDQAAKVRAAVIVVGGVGASGAMGALLGSTAERVVRHAEIPVLVARMPRSPAFVVAGTDFSDPSLPALVAAGAEARHRGATLIACHAVEMPPLAGANLEGVVSAIPPDVLADIEKQATVELKAALAKQGVDAEVRVAQGDPASLLMQVADEVAADLLVVGTHGRSGLERFLIGSVAERVVRHAHCSVLVVRLSDEVDED